MRALKGPLGVKRGEGDVRIEFLFKTSWLGLPASSIQREAVPKLIYRCIYWPFLVLYILFSNNFIKSISTNRLFKRWDSGFERSISNVFTSWMLILQTKHTCCVIIQVLVLVALGPPLPLEQRQQPSVWPPTPEPDRELIERDDCWQNWSHCCITAAIQPSFDNQQQPGIHENLRMIRASRDKELLWPA